MRSFNLRLVQGVKHIATTAVVLATLIHATTDSAQANPRVGKQPNNVGFSFDLNDNAELKDGVFKGAVQNPFFLTSTSSDKNCPPSVSLIANCISLNPGDLDSSISSKSSILSFYKTFLNNGLQPSDEGFIPEDVFQSTYAGGTDYKTILYPTDPNETRLFSLSLEIFLPRSEQDFTQRIPSYLDFQQTFSANDIWIKFTPTIPNEESPNERLNIPQVTSFPIKNITDVSVEAEPVPEPIEGAVLGTGIMGAGLLLLKRRKVKQQSSKL